MKCSSRWVSPVGGQGPAVLRPVAQFLLRPGPSTAARGRMRRLQRSSAVKCSIGSTTGCTITEKAPTRAFYWLKATTTAFTFKTLLRHYAKQALPHGLST